MLTSPAFKNAVAAGCYVAVLASVDHPSGAGYFWEGTGILEYDGKEWRGAGLVGGISQSRRSVDLRIDEMTLWINGLDAGEVSQLDDNVKNRVAQIYLAALNDNRRVVATLTGEEILLDYQRYVIDESMTARVEINGQAGLWMLERATDAVYSQENASAEFPDETGFSKIPELQNKDTSWTQT